MDGATGECGGLGEAIVFLKYFEGLPDARQRGKVVYPLREVLLLCLMAVLAGAETIMDIARGDVPRNVEKGGAALLALSV
jgi:hypothetical protein